MSCTHFVSVCLVLQNTFQKLTMKRLASVWHAQFPQAGVLVVWMLSDNVFAIQVFVCEVCHMLFDNITNLKRHRRTCGVRIPCQHCERTFASRKGKGGLRLHKKMVHGDNEVKNSGVIFVSVVIVY